MLAPAGGQGHVPACLPAQRHVPACLARPGTRAPRRGPVYLVADIRLNIVIIGTRLVSLVELQI